MLARGTYEVQIGVPFFQKNPAVTLKLLLLPLAAGLSGRFGGRLKNQPLKHLKARRVQNLQRLHDEAWIKEAAGLESDQAFHQKKFCLQLFRADGAHILLNVKESKGKLRR